MTSQEYRDTLARLGFTIVGAGRFLEINERQARRYASGETPVPGSTAKFLRYLIAADVTPVEVERLVRDRSTGHHTPRS